MVKSPEKKEENQETVENRIWAKRAFQDREWGLKSDNIKPVEWHEELGQELLAQTEGE